MICRKAGIWESRWIMGLWEGPMLAPLGNCLSSFQTFSHSSLSSCLLSVLSSSPLSLIINNQHPYPQRVFSFQADPHPTIAPPCRPAGTGGRLIQSFTLPEGRGLCSGTGQWRAGDPRTHHNEPGLGDPWRPPPSTGRQQTDRTEKKKKRRRTAAAPAIITAF